MLNAKYRHLCVLCRFSLILIENVCTLICLAVYRLLTWTQLPELLGAFPHFSSSLPQSYFCHCFFLQLCEQFGLLHESQGQGKERFIQIRKIPKDTASEAACTAVEQHNLEHISPSSEEVPPVSLGMVNITVILIMKHIVSQSLEHLLQTPRNEHVIRVDESFHY